MDKDVKNIIKNMKTFTERMQKQKMTKAVRKGANIVKKQAVNGAKQADDPSTTEKIYRNIVARKRTGKKYKNRTVYAIGVQGGAKKDGTLKQGKGGDTFYWRFVEFGTSKAKARPFLRPALENNQNKVHTTIFKTLKEEFIK